MTSFSQVKLDTGLTSYTLQASLCFSKVRKSFNSKSWCCSGLQQPQKQSGNRLRVQPTEREIRLWVQFVRIQCENFFPQAQAKFVICSVHFKENCFTRAFDTTQRRQLKPGSLPSIWGRKEPSTERDSTRQSRTKEKERRKLRSLLVLLMLYICTFMHRMFDILISPI